MDLEEMEHRWGVLFWIAVTFATLFGAGLLLLLALVIKWALGKV